jgi:hypothetical protein
MARRKTRESFEIGAYFFDHDTVLRRESKFGVSDYTRKGLEYKL